ncbi:MAG: diguanylate cyclase [Coprobacillus sp.]
MANSDIDYLVEQLRCVLLNKPLQDPKSSIQPELEELQGAIYYLSDCMIELHLFLRKLCEGELSAEKPSKYNFLASELKELQSILQHLTWQTSQVAQGDYKQKVNFLGEFSMNFNTMIEQLEEREIKLKEKSIALSQSMELLVQTMDTLEDWILVIDVESNSIVYVNDKAREKFYNPESGDTVCGQYCKVLDELLHNEKQDSFQKIYNCPISGKTLNIKGHSINWKDQDAFAYFIKDITADINEKILLEEMAYKDVLTSLYNRRYCIEKISSFLKKQISFSLVIIDMDNLKYVNDNLGHTVGDDYLMMVSQILASHSLEYGSACRIGGDEFALIYPYMSQTQTAMIMQDISLKIQQSTSEYSASISYGIVGVHEKEKISIEHIMGQADERMYEMKATHHKIEENNL